MTSNAQKTPFGQSLNRFASGVAQKVQALLGKAFPASVKSVNGPFVNVSFQIQQAGATIPSVTVPVLGSRYWRPAIQPGDMGTTIAADASLAGVSAVTNGVADLAPPSNLTALVYASIGSKNWPAVDQNTSVATGGPNGLLLRDSENPNSTVNVTSSAITLISNGTTLEINGTGIFLQGVEWLPHVHTKTQPGSGFSGPVNS